MLSELLGDVSQIVEGLTALLGLVLALVGLAVRLYLKAKAREADLTDFLNALNEAEGEIRASVQAGLIKELEEAVDSGLDLLNKMNRTKKLPQHLAERAQARFRRVFNGVKK